MVWMIDYGSTSEGGGKHLWCVMDQMTSNPAYAEIFEKASDVIKLVEPAERGAMVDHMLSECTEGVRAVDREHAAERVVEAERSAHARRRSPQSASRTQETAERVWQPGSCIGSLLVCGH